MSRTRLLLNMPPLLIILSTGACGEKTDPDPKFSVRDSAGVEIVESSAPLLDPNEAWRISEAPVLQIGEREGRDPYLLARITSEPMGRGMVFRLEDGRIVVCNGMDQTIRFFDSAGVFLRQTGGQGDGPGEFRFKWACLPSHNGFVAYGMPRITVWYTTEGEPLKTIRFPMVEGQIGEFYGVFSDGSFLMSANLTPGSSSELGPGVHTRTQDLFTLSEDATSSEELLTIGLQNNACSSDRCLGQVFGPTGQLLPVGDEFLFGWPQTYEIGLAEKTGRVTRSIRRAWDAPPVTPEDVEWWEGARRDSNTEWHLEIMVLPDHHPAYDRLYVDRTGSIWVRHPHPRFDHPHRYLRIRFPYARTWDVFDSSGRWITTMEMPPAFEVHDIGDDYVLGVWRDEMDVEYVRMYALDRRGRNPPS